MTARNWTSGILIARGPATNHKDADRLKLQFLRGPIDYTWKQSDTGKPLVSLGENTALQYPTEIERETTGHHTKMAKISIFTRRTGLGSELWKSL